MVRRMTARRNMMLAAMRGYCEATASGRSASTTRQVLAESANVPAAVLDVLNLS
jgi:hypothetical protein